MRALLLILFVLPLTGCGITGVHIGDLKNLNFGRAGGDASGSYSEPEPSGSSHRPIIRSSREFTPEERREAATPEYLK
ncbi:MAG: hypothetical protein H6839_16670 [Planctomycetes bacterium]|nr:hypothetical protein [Planctomycetota bacterium]